MYHCHLLVYLEIENCELFDKCRWRQSSQRCCNVNNWEDRVQDLACAPYLHLDVILQLSIQEVEGNRLLEFRILWKMWHLMHEYSPSILLSVILNNLNNLLWTEMLQTVSCQHSSLPFAPLLFFCKQEWKCFNLIPCGIILTSYQQQQTQLDQIWYAVRLDPVNAFS